MRHLPVLRFGQPYRSIETITLQHHATGEAIADVSQANSGLVRRDIVRAADDVLEHFSVSQLLDICKRAAQLFVTAVLPAGDSEQSFEDYLRDLSATTGMPLAYCRINAQKIQRVLEDMDVIIRGLTRGFDLQILDRGFGEHAGGTLSYFREGRLFGAVLPSNSPGVHGLWIPAVALKAPVVLKPGRDEPWTPLRIIAALCAAGLPREACGFYPTDHGGAAELLRSVNRSMLFGDASTTRAWAGDPHVELHGPGYSKVVLGEDMADRWEAVLDVLVESVVANAGRSCINASAIVTPRHGAEIAEAMAERLSRVRPLPVDDPQAQVAAFSNAAGAERISAMIDGFVQREGLIDVTEQHRGSPRLARLGRAAYLLPTVLWAPGVEELVSREFPFPFVTVAECPGDRVPEFIGRSLVVTAITEDPSLRAALMASPNVDRLNFGPIPTYRISWDQPHEGNLFEHLYRQRAFQVEPAA
jgi:acyl-CoA reductase-like NAD-dependent aldehyde dehydrogenase